MWICPRLAREPQMPYFAQDVPSWNEFIEVVSGHEGRWVYRGQRQDWPLQPSIERYIRLWDCDIALSQMIERQMIRDFRRRYPDQADATIQDTLYCLALMQHHGAPTRLLDWTYSPYVAAKFAIEEGASGSVIWCINTDWCRERAEAEPVVGGDVKRRADDALRNNCTFHRIYMDARRPFVCLENPFRLSERLILQRGVFPGDISVGLQRNIEEMEGWDSEHNVVKLVLRLNSKERVAEFANHLKQMNMTSALLFPGFDGFASSLRELILHYESLAHHGTGVAGSTVPMWP
jgi:hypothetical protein